MATKRTPLQRTRTKKRPMAKRAEARSCQPVRHSICRRRPMLLRKTRRRRLQNRRRAIRLSLDRPTARATPPAQSEPTDKSPVKSAADAAPPSSSGGPKPFPEEGPKESPLPVPKLPHPRRISAASDELAGPGDSLSGDSVSRVARADRRRDERHAGEPDGARPDTGQRSSANAPPQMLLQRAPPPTLPETKSADTSNSSTPAPTQRPAADLRSEGAADFQGDGTVGEAAALGPQRPQLNIEKVAPQNALLGQPLIYAIWSEMSATARPATSSSKIASPRERSSPGRSPGRN